MRLAHIDTILSCSGVCFQELYCHSTAPLKDFPLVRQEPIRSQCNHLLLPVPAAGLPCRDECLPCLISHQCPNVNAQLQQIYTAVTHQSSDTQSVFKMTSVFQINDSRCQQSSACKQHASAAQCSRPTLLQHDCYMTDWKVPQQHALMFGPHLGSQQQELVTVEWQRAEVQVNATCLRHAA